MDEIKNAIFEIDEEIKELQSRKEYLQSIDTSTVPTEDEWHEICLSPLRGDDALGLFVKNIFPEAENITVKANNVVFYINEIKCYLPTSAVRGIGICTSEFARLYNPDKHPHSYTTPRFEKLSRYLKADTWQEKMDVMMPNSNIFVKWINWMFIYKPFQEKYEQEYIELETSLKEKYQKHQNLYMVQRAEYIKKCQILKEKVEPILLRFTDNLYPYAYGGYDHFPSLQWMYNYYEEGYE